MQHIALGTNETAIGYYQDKSVLNPLPTDLITFRPGDRVVVLAQDGDEHMAK